MTERIAPKPGKAHIQRPRPVYRKDVCNYRWQCASFNWKGIAVFIGHGDTPLEAYIQWKAARDMVMNCELAA